MSGARSAAGGRARTPLRTFTPAKVAEVEAGTRLIADDGFTCIGEGSILTAEEHPDGTLFVRCGQGRHRLDGQTDDGISYVGLALAPSGEEA